MLHRAEHEKNKKVSYQLANFIQRNRLIFIVLALAVIVTPIVFYVVDSVNRKAFAEATEKSYAVDQKLEEYTKEADVDKKALLEQELIALFDEAIKQFGSFDAGVRALRHRASFNIQKMNEEGAANKKELLLNVIGDLIAIPGARSASVLAPTALMDAAATVGNIPTMLIEDTTGTFNIEPSAVETLVREKMQPAAEVKLDSFPAIALYLYQTVVNDFPESVHVPEALINMGAFYEGLQSYQEAGAVYDRLESEFSQNDWTKVAINRKIKLQADGLLAD